MLDIEDHIRKAIEAGQFADLPGKGKPLPIDEDPFTDPEWRLAHHLLKNNGFTLPWIEKRQTILDGLETARSRLAGSARWRQAALSAGQPAWQVEAEWEHAKEAFRQQIQILNKQILTYNLEAPSPAFHLILVNLENEITSL